MDTAATASDARTATAATYVRDRGAAGRFRMGMWLVPLSLASLPLMILGGTTHSPALIMAGGVLWLAGFPGALLVYIGVATLGYRWLKAGDSYMHAL